MVLTEAKAPFDREWDAWDRRGEAALEDYREARDAWVRLVLAEVVGWGDDLRPAPPAATVTLPDGQVSETASLALTDGEGGSAALVWVIDPVRSLRDPMADGWSATPIDRMEMLLAAADVPVGVVTDGRWWGLVSVPRERDGLPSSGVVDAQTWVEERAVRDAVLELLSPLRLVGGAEDERLPELFADSVLAAEQVTDSLGGQVRQAVELVVAELSDGSRAAREAGRPDPLPEPGQVYDAVVTVLMRVVFLLFAEERGLLPQDRLYGAGYGLSRQLDALDARARGYGEETLDGTSEVWHRLLATSGALHGGASFEDLRLPAYGGSLMDPQRFPWLEARDDAGRLRVAVSDRVMRAVLDAVQVARVGGEARRVSFREIDVEQIGYIYEGLLGYTCGTVDRLTVGLIGTAGSEPEVPVEVLDDLVEEHGDDASTARAVIDWAKGEQSGAKPPTPARLAKAFAAGDTMEDAERALRAVAPDDPATREALRPWVGAIRRDLRGRLVVLRPGDLAVVETAGRRHAGAHYTPRSLAEEVVEHALAPLCHSPGPLDPEGYDGPAERWRVRPPEELLDLTVADIACGSGAFLVAAVRYLADRLVESRTLYEGRSGGDAAEMALQARREVVARCVYGADIDPMAVEMCKLSLWLVSLDPTKPFSFVDDKVFVGNSLLGLTSVRQLEELHLDPAARDHEHGRWEISASGELESVLDVGVHVERAMRYRATLRQEIDPTEPSRDGRAKQRQLATARAEVAGLRRAADGVIATALPLGGKPGRQLDDALTDLRGLVTADAAGDSAALDARIARGLTPSVEMGRERWQPLHWVLEVPDVMARGGFDAIIGNPPFIKGKAVSSAVGADVRDFLVNQIAHGVRGNSDMVAYFFLRAQSLLRKEGVLGLIATNTLAQGDTREVGLDQMARDGLTVFRSIQSRPWPARSADLEYAAVWGVRHPLVPIVPRISDDKRVGSITTYLEAAGRVQGLPLRLRENLGQCFIGNYVNCTEQFSMDRSVALRMIEREPGLTDVLFPFYGGDQVNGSPSEKDLTWIVDFTEVPDDEIKNYGSAYQWVEERVRPAREKLVNKPAQQRRWWAYERNAKGMRAALVGLDSCLAMVLVSKVVLPDVIPTRSVPGHALAVFPTEQSGDLAVLSSTAHTLWAITHGSTMGSAPRYTPSDVFETFPRPTLTDRLETAGRTLDTERREIMLRRDLGLTKLYNLVHDPELAAGADADVDRLREIHVEVDEATMEAYGWDDLPLDHGHHTYRQMTRWTISAAARVEVLDRLLEENHRRAAQEGSL